MDQIEEKGMKAGIHGFSRFLIQVKYMNINFMKIGIPKGPFRRPGTEMGLTYSAACQTYWVIWDFPVLFPDRKILCLAEEILY